MTGEGAYRLADAAVFYCVVCGPVLKEQFGDGTEANQAYADGEMIHHEHRHPAEEDLPQ